MGGVKEREKERERKRWFQCRGKAVNVSLWRLIPPRPSFPPPQSFWAKFDKLESGNAVMVGHGPTTSGPSIALHYAMTGYRLRSGFWSNDVDTAPFAFPNTWYHIVFVNDALHGRQIYVNGAKMADAASTGRYLGVGKFYLGAVSYGTPNLEGQLDEVMVFDRALSQSDVFHLLNNVHRQPPVGVSSCEAVQSARMPTAKYFGLTDEAPATTFCGQGLHVAPPGYLLPAVPRRAPRFYLSMNDEVRDTVGRTAVTLSQGQPTFVDGPNARALKFANGLNYNVLLSTDMFTESWTFALFVRFGRPGTGGDNILLCGGVTQNNRGLQLAGRVG